MTSRIAQHSQRRTGDSVKISGGYQYQARFHGHPVQKFWHHAKTAAIDVYLPPSSKDTVLDIGCGSGVMTDYLAQTAHRAIGLDGSTDAIDFAQHQFRKKNLSFVHALIDEHYPLRTPIQKMYCMELIEHIYFPQAVQMLKICKTHLSAQGKLLITTPNYASAWPVIEKVLDTLRLTPDFSEQHVCFYTKQKLEELAHASGYTIQSMGSYCGIAPWISPFSWKMAERMNQFELRHRHFYGSLLITVFEPL